MISSKLASLEARIARLESSLKTTAPAFKTQKKASFLDVHTQTVLDNIKDQFPKNHYTLRPYMNNGFTIQGENGQAIVEYKGGYIIVSTENFSTGRKSKQKFEILSGFEFDEEEDFEDHLSEVEDDVSSFIERSLN